MEDSAELLDSKAELDQEELDRLLRDNQALKGRLDELERENRQLRQRNFDLSVRYGRSVENRRQPFELAFSDSEHQEDIDDTDNGVASGSIDGSETTTTNSSKNNETMEATDNPGKGATNGKTVASDAKRRSNKNNGDGMAASATSGGINEAAAAVTDQKTSRRTSYKGKPQERGGGDSGVPDAERDRDTESSTPSRDKRSVGEDQQRLNGGAPAIPTAATGTSGASRRKAAKQLKCYAELDGHEGAIYSTQYSPSGILMASASFDKTVRIWDIGEQKTMAVLSGHQQSVFDVSWREDSAALVSAAFDRICIEWDIEARSEANRLSCDGLVQCVRYSMYNSNLVYSGDSSGHISIHDTRQPSKATSRLSNDGAMVNTIYCFNDESRLMSGDNRGEIKMWDVRIGRFMRLVSAEAQQRAISHISVMKNEKSGTEYMAANSYDNVLRVYDRVDDPSVPEPRVIHELHGIRSRNWPIKNAFLDPRVAQDKLLSLYEDDYFELDTRSQNEARGLKSMLFLITASAEPFAYLYKLGTHSKTVRVDDKAWRGTRQRLEGHSDRVYAVATHPSEIKACTAGADGTMRLWHIPSAGRLLKES